MPHGGAQAVRISSRVRRGKGAGKTNLEGAQRRMTEFTRRIYEVVKQIPKGRVASYGQVAQLAGNPRGARGVGFALHRNPRAGRHPLPPRGVSGRQHLHRLCLRRARSAAPHAGGRGRPLFAGRPRGYGRMPLAVSPLGPFCQAEKGRLP